MTDQPGSPEPAAGGGLPGTPATEQPAPTPVPAPVPAPAPATELSAPTPAPEQVLAPAPAEPEQTAVHEPSAPAEVTQAQTEVAQTEVAQAQTGVTEAEVAQVQAEVTEAQTEVTEAQAETTQAQTPESESPAPAPAPAQETVRLSMPHTAPLLPEPTPVTQTEDDARQALVRVRDEVAKAVVGQEATVSGLVLALLCRGHVLLEGVPGVAKTLLVRALSAALDLDTARVQFTPDLMPGDVTGSLVYDARTARFSFREGPVFTNLLLADEINRTPPKTQASLLEAMQERQVSVDGRPLPLPDPFLVIATQNPVEYEGTYPLPEAQLDRFLLKLTVPLPPREVELKVLARHAEGFDPQNLAAAGIRPVATAQDLAAAAAGVRRVDISEAVMGYIVDVVRATRTSPSLSLGVSPRGAAALLATCRAWAWLSGRDYVTPDDVKALARPTLRHRMQLRPEAELEGTTTEKVLDTVLATVPVPR
ncbi:MAG: MoxR-like ATPase [Actinomycetota bacterium]|nr:MoxR-like ATPase [Actinomycetota bacterium]